VSFAWAGPALVLIGAYAAGCVVGAWYLVRLRTGQDLRALGSGNAGATNAGRVLGRGGFALALLIDAGKGAAVTIGVRALGGSAIVLAAAMVAVVTGHVWPVQLGFRGGKGAATALGLLAVYDFKVAAILLACLVVLLALTRRLDAGGLSTLGIAPFVAAFYGPEMAVAGGLAVVVGFVFWAHFARRSQ
jgi:glycerol-3-phosphate acyltransferase PlsY